MMLRTRLMLGIGSIVILMMVPILLSLQTLDRLRQSADWIRTSDFRDALLIGSIRSVMEEIDQTRNYVALFPTDESRARMMQRVATVRGLLDSLTAQAELQSSVAKARVALESLEGGSLRAHELAAAERPALADSVVDRSVVPAIALIEQNLDVMETSVRERTRHRVDDIAAESSTARETSLILLTGAAILAVLIGVWLTQSVSRPIDELDAGMRAVSEGDFGHPLEIAPQRKDEFGRLAKSFNSMATQLRELDRLKAEFISVASHELKTPINVVMGYLQLLNESVYGELNSRQREIVATLTAQTKSLSRLVRQLLDVSRFEAGGGKVEPRNIPLPAFLGDLERTFRVLAIQRNVDFSVARGPDLPSEVLWDPERINEVLGNLLSNAFKFTPSGGRVELSVSREGDLVCMKVRDTGAGIPATELAYVFEKFYQANNQTTGIKGTGLGLAIAKGIVTEHGGNIGVESTVGVGTTFTIYLPTRSTASRLAALRPQEVPAA